MTSDRAAQSAKIERAIQKPKPGPVGKAAGNSIRTAPRGKPKPKRTREEKGEDTRLALLEAAARVVGRHGYNGASIARITAKAKVAQGTFYNYFASRQDILDQLLPAMGDMMLDYMRSHMQPEATGWQRERDRLRAYLDFLVEHPWFHRLVNEAETLAPRAHKIYFDKISQGYARGLRRSRERGEIRGFSDKELEALTYMLMSVRTYIAQRYAYRAGTVVEIDPSILDTYARFAEHGLFGVDVR